MRNGVATGFRLALAGQAYHQGYCAGRAGLPRECPRAVATNPELVAEWKRGWDAAKREEHRASAA